MEKASAKFTANKIAYALWRKVIHTKSDSLHTTTTQKEWKSVPCSGEHYLLVWFPKTPSTGVSYYCLVDLWGYYIQVQFCSGAADHTKSLCMLCEKDNLSFDNTCCWTLQNILLAHIYKT
jgi:hypothetical protein